MKSLLNRSFADLQAEFPYMTDFFTSNALAVPEGQDTSKSLEALFEALDVYFLEQLGIEKAQLCQQFVLYMENMQKRFSRSETEIESVTILGGHNKLGEAEDVTLTLKKGDVVSVVGSTGSGKSRLLADIEWLAQADTPTGRKILINGRIPPAEWRFSIEHKLVAQLSQNMNFVMDLNVGEFIRVHMESRGVKSGFIEKQAQILSEANKLAGEPIFKDTPITALSGGQSRSLMIADTAFLSNSPIVLIDEIENAGIDKKIAVELLIKSEKIVLIATHDPVLALQADRRIVIKNGGIAKIFQTSTKEKEMLQKLEQLNGKLLEYRELLKSGRSLC